MERRDILLRPRLHLETPDGVGGAQQVVRGGVVERQPVEVDRPPLVPGDQLWENYSQVLSAGTTKGVAAPVGPMMFNSLVMALAIAFGKIAISIIASFAIVFFRFPLRNFFFWMIFVTLMLPVEVRIIPTFKVVADLGMINSYVGLTLPLIASATATFLFRQFFLTVPDELAEAARIDGAGPLRFFWDVILPLSKTSIAALFVGLAVMRMGAA